MLLDNKAVLTHTPDEPFVHAGKGSGKLSMREGQWFISESAPSSVALTRSQYDAGRSSIRFWGGSLSVTFTLTETDGNLVLSLQRASIGINRLWLSFPARGSECVFGGGAQYDELDLRGKKLSMWVSDRQVDKARENPVMGRKLGGKTASPFPQPVFVTENLTFVCANTNAYSVMDFRHAKNHRMEFWEIPQSVTIGTAETPAELMGRMTRVTGRQAMLPHWAQEGVWLEAHGGIQPMVDKLEKIVDSGAAAGALWIRDWTGERDTAEGKKIFYDWIWNRELYPRLDKLIPELTSRNVRVLANINPHLSIEGRMFAEASAKGYLIKKPEGGNYITDMGGFMAGHVDLSNTDACTWFKELIKTNILGLGFSGYMADMGAFLPDDAVLFSKEDPVKAHNSWALRWAKLNRQAIREAGRSGDTVFFTRTGYFGSNAYTPLSTAGDLNAGWGKQDGLPAALTAMLSMSMTGMGLSVSEVGGTMSVLAGRTKELFLRWLEWAAFTPVMCLVEGEPGGWQFDSDAETLKMFARLVNIHSAMAPYMRACVRENANDGMPVMRPMFLSFPKQPELYRVHDQYMLGDEVLVAPVMKKKQTKRSVLLPEGYWIHLWTGRQYMGGGAEVYAPLGKPPVFYRPAGKHANLFDTFMAKY
ncbi:alpha-glucosidase [Clostridia bacterium]|nr:alpha-glucosidase [Clostridia bacterium]